MNQAAAPSEPGNAAHLAVEHRYFVASKLSAPPRRPGIVDRPILLNHLRNLSHPGVVLVSAPAGYGKTTLLALWREFDERPFGWVTLDSADNDPVVLVASVLAALDPILHLDPDVRNALKGPEPPLEEFVLPALVDACMEHGKGLVLVLDDVHLVTDRRSLAAIAYLGERLPTGCQLALATRADPRLPLARWRAHGRLAEIRAPELAMYETEAGVLLDAVGVHLAQAQVARLVDRTEGWPAAMYLAGLALRYRSHPEEFVDRFEGTSRHIADFLSEDVLARQPEDVIAFLLRTSVLAELSPALCDSVTGETNAEIMLRELERSNLFVVPLDEDRREYRYHHLFGEYLRAELVRRQPEDVPELHRRAWRWYREHGIIGRAVAHAQASGDFEVAAGLVAAAWPAMADRGQVETVHSWLAGFTEAQIAAHAPLAIAAAWMASLAGDSERAGRFVAAAEGGTWEGPMPDGTASLESDLALLSCGCGGYGISRSRADAQRAADLEHDGTWGLTVALESLGIAQTLEGDFASARRALEQAVQRTRAKSSTGMLCLAHLALISLREGNEAQALQYARRAHAIADRPEMRNHIPTLAAYAVLACLLSRRGDLDEAAAAVERASAQLPRVTRTSWWLMIEARILLAPALVALGRRAEATTRLDEAEALLQTHPDAGQLPDWYRETLRTLRLQHGRRPPPSGELSEAELRVLHLLNNDLTLAEIGRELYLSRNTVKSHLHSIYRKLGVSSRSDVARAMKVDARSLAAGA